MGSDKINQILRERKIQRKKVAKYRKGRIYKRFNEKKEQYQQQIQDKLHTNLIDQKKKEFYEKVFAKQPQKKQVKNQIVQQTQKIDEDAIKLNKLKSKKKMYIKKIQKYKTPKGQPLMKNYIKYALTKIQQTLLKQKKIKK